MGIRTRRAHQHSRTHIVGFGIAGFFGFLALLAAVLTLSLGSLVNDWLQDLPDYTSADAYLVAEPTTVYAADNSVIAEYYLQNRRSVELDQISDYVIKGTVDVEDERFYRHNGVDPQGIVRASVGTLFGRSEGASTITQQLVRNTVLSDEQFERSLKRKVREAYIAIQMEKMYTKDQILNMYLNTIYYGSGAYGIQAASITYFNKNASDLTLSEAATLVGIPNSPSNYDPTVNMDACKSRRNKVLDNMLRIGDITQEEHDAAAAEDIVLNLGSFSDSIGTFPYFTDYVKQLLLEDFDSDTIMQGGLQVYTTIQPSTQRAAEAAVTDNLNAIGNDELQAALCAVDPSDGHIVAMVGGRDYSLNQFNMATQARRQPGSSFKTFTLVAALQEGMSPDVLINCNSPMQFTPTWRVQNFMNAQYGTITMRDAFMYSSNTGFVQIAQAVGATNVVDAARLLGVDVDLPAYDSLTLGTVGIPPVQMAEAYATVAAGGVHRDAIAITKILDRNGNVVYEHTDNPNQAIPSSVAEAAIEVMKTVCRGNGTANAISYQMTADQPVAGKTGTSENYRDLWFCGVTPQLSVAIWCGYAEEAPVYIYGTNAHPYSTSVPIFIDFVNAALADTPRAEFPVSDETITYKKNSEWKFSQTNKQDEKTDEEKNRQDENTQTQIQTQQNETPVVQPETVTPVEPQPTEPQQPVEPQPDPVTPPTEEPTA